MMATYISLVWFVVGLYTVCCASSANRKDEGRCELPPLEEDGDWQCSVDTSQFQGFVNNSRLRLYAASSNIRNNVAIEFSTLSENGILFYASNNNHTEFTAVYLETGNVVLAKVVKNSTIRLVSNGTYNDGGWHLVEINKTDHGRQLVIDCVVQGNISGRPTSKNIEDQVYIGGLPSTIAPRARVNLNNMTDHFCGCVGKVLLGKYDPTSKSKKYNVVPCKQESSTESGVHNTKLISMVPKTSLPMPIEENITSMPQHPLSTANSDNLRDTSTDSQSTSTDSQSTSTDSQSTVVFQTTTASTDQPSPHEPLTTSPTTILQTSPALLKDIPTDSKSEVLLPTSVSVSTESDNFTVLIQPQTHEEGPLSNLPIYISIGIVLLTFVCILHLVYRKTVRLIKQKKDYDKVPLREMQELPVIERGSKKKITTDDTPEPSCTLKDEQGHGKGGTFNDKHLEST